MICRDKSAEGGRNKAKQKRKQHTWKNSYGKPALSLGLSKPKKKAVRKYLGAIMVTRDWEGE